jgi:DegV family protein with EDD domain
MERDKRVAVVTDSGTSMLQKSPEAKELGITVVPLEIRFWENDKYVSYSDADVDTADFYNRMESCPKLPQTSGAIPWRFIETYLDLKEKVESIISIHITSKHSGVYNSAVLAKNTIHYECESKCDIEVVDSELVSLATWFSVETAAKTSQKGATLKEIKDEITEVMDKTQLYVTLDTFDNLKKGGRGQDVLRAILASALSIYPVIGFIDGKLKNMELTRSVQKARNRMIDMVGDAGKLVRLAVIHTNTPELAQNTKDALSKIFKENIQVYEAKAVLGVHAGPGAIGIAFQKA